ncbi:chitobiase/beta-hexosaminidase C-terminal domain-containing protein [Vitiosangium sp. GDMCC 1.1324]|uniref:chitobiase/beta-hexosaminidase C-terminal domain-containing protein n=1 Tax=Vitiosangium sp. (strain GDMCC 1.1324) TaxID=2138576 RepID=UPI000D3544E5|nr:chitobiase/beta-hexosaminidase C-terminal domain-containing protein [Vitiosangium sp. GDMCC 1.1324]PTL82811.1 hypothetical protein DAT35_18805 [Vitiosangium sp. GDMCC 1.1324]
MYEWKKKLGSRLAVMVWISALGLSACDPKPPPEPGSSDTTPPSTRATPREGTFTVNVTLELLCDDGAGSGCAATYYTTDGSEPTERSARYASSLLLTKNTTLKFFSVDKAGNAETIQTQTYEVDTQPPTTTATPAGRGTTSALSVTLSCTDSSQGSGCAATYYTLDGTTPTASSPRYSAPLSITTSTTLKFFSTDKAGNAEQVRTEVYSFDFVAPTTTATPASGWYNTIPSVVLSCDDSASGCAATHYTLDGTTPTLSSPRYTAPLSLTANTTLKFFSVDKADNAEAVRSETYLVDTAAPTTTITPPAGTYGDTQSVKLACDDGTGSGCKATRYTLDGSMPGDTSPLYTGPITITATTTVRYSSTDQVGNREPVRQAAYFIDKVAPSVSASPRGGIFHTAQSVTLTCTDDALGGGCGSIHYTTDGSRPTPASLTYFAPILVATTTTLQFLAVDTVGNVSDVRSETYNLDTVAPSTEATPAGGTYAEAKTVTLRCTDGSGSGCFTTYYTVDGSTPTRSSSTYSVPLSISANTVLKYFSVDAAGNTEEVRTDTYFIDLIAPTVSASPAGGNYRTAQSVTLTCTDSTPGSGCAAIHYTRNGDTPTTGSATYTAPLNVDSTTNLLFLAVDKAGNTSSVRQEVYFIDTLAPTTTATPAGGTYHTAQSVTLTCADGSTGIGCSNTYYTLDGTPPTTGSTRYTGPISISANTTLKFFSVDKLGNSESAQTQTYVIDTIAPTVSASPVGGNYRTAQSVTLTCTDNASGTGCDAIHYTLNGDTPTTGSATYTAPLNVDSTTNLQFLAVDKAGNASSVRQEVYFIDTLAPTTTATPAGGTYHTAQSVTLTCADGSTGIGCSNTYYTLDDTPPTTGSTRYTGPISISANTTLKFFSVDKLGNSESAQTQTYVIAPDTTPPTTTANPAGGVYASAQSVTLACSDTGGIGCAATYYTLDGTTPTPSSTRYTSPISISYPSTLIFFSVDALGNAEIPRSETYSFGLPAPDISAQIARIRSLADGTLSEPLDYALVTYTKQTTGPSDPAGFFVQAEKAGPALFVAVDPASLTPSPKVGDRVSLRATGKKTVGGVVQVISLDSTTFAIRSRGEPVEFLRNDVSNVDLSTSVSEYESELITASGTVASTFAAAGTGHVSANFVTLGTPSISSNLKLRIPTALQDAFDLVQTCAVRVNAPLWRSNAQAQPSAWATPDFASLSCPSPNLLLAMPLSRTSVLLSFDRRIDPASVLANGSQFTFDNGLVATSATVTARQVQLTTSSQTDGTLYRVTVASTVKDTVGASLAVNSATFTGNQAPATLRINELNPNITNGKDLIELLVVKGGNTNGLTLVVDGTPATTLATFPNVQVATGDIIVVHIAPAAAPTDAPASETLGKSQYPKASYGANFDTAWDFLGGATGISYSAHRVLRVKDPMGNTQDAVPFVVDGQTTSTFPAQLQAIQAEGLWLPADCGGMLCTYTSVPSAMQVSVNWSNLTSTSATSVQRYGGMDTNQYSDWSPAGTSSFGLPNP